MVCDIGYCKVGEKDGMMMIPVRWQWEVMIDMDWNDWMWICQIEHPLVILKDGVSVILVLVTLVSRSKYWIGIVVRYSKSVSKCQSTGFI